MPHTASAASFVVSAIALAITASACSSSTTNAGPGGNANALATAYADAYCDYVQRCNPFAVRTAYGEVAKCKETLAKTTRITVAAKGVSIEQSQMDACAAKLRAVACDSLAEANAACQFRGTLPDGTQCASSAQCASSSCFYVVTEEGLSSDCGTCSAEVGEGADCTHANCQLGLLCVDDKCIKPVAEGATCAHASQCDSDLDCVGTKCTKPLPAGAACELTETAALCQIFKGFNCVPSSPTSAAGTCQEVKVAALGEGCGYDQATGVITTCGGASCSSLTNGKCLAYLVEGDACGASAGSDCGPGTSCKGGVCARPNPSACE